MVCGSASRGVTEVLQKCAIEAIKNDEVGLVGVALALTGTAPKHLFKEDAGLDGPKEDDELQVWNIDTRRKEVHGHDDGWVWSIAEFPDALKRTVNATSDLGNE